MRFWLIDLLICSSLFVPFSYVKTLTIASMQYIIVIARHIIWASNTMTTIEVFFEYSKQLNVQHVQIVECWEIQTMEGLVL